MDSARVVGICGCGQMGAAAAVSFARAGYAVKAWTRSHDRIPEIEGTIASLDGWLDRFVGPCIGPRGALEVTADLDHVDAAAQVVVECIVESLEEKVSLFRRLPGAAGRGALFLTTTSGLSITEMDRRAGLGGRLVGAHFWNPPHLMPLVEVIRGGATADQALREATEVVRSLGKIAVQVNRDVPGFIGNRLLHALWREAIAIVERGIASAEDVDRVARLTFGLRIPAVGPLENMDLVGLDLVRTIHGYLLPDLADDHVPAGLLEAKVAAGAGGMKSGHGFHDWKARDPRALVELRDQQILHELAFLRGREAL